MDILANLRPAPIIRPMLNVGCCFDIPTGRYEIGKYGESILNGGLPHFTGVGARPNMFKTVIVLFWLLRILDRYLGSKAVVYDTEVSLTMQRIQELAAEIAEHWIAGVDLVDAMVLVLTSKIEYNGTEWYEWLRTATEGRAKLPKEEMVQTPFIDKEGKPISMLKPFATAIDSLSAFAAANVIRIQEEGGIGDSDRNTEALRDAGAKSQMIVEVPTLTARNGIYMIMSAHVGDEHALDPRMPPQKKLAFLKNRAKFKNVPEKFLFHTNCLWYITGATVLQHDKSKAPEYPRNSDDDLRGDTDLQLINMMNLRCKNGPTGLPIDVIVSQSEGLKEGLTQLHYLKTYDRFGLGGNLQNYHLDLLPDVNLTRTTVRNKIETTPKLRRALEITSEMCQMNNMWHDLPEGLMCTPKELYDDLKAKGYDWDVLLETRGWWTFDNDKHPIPFLSTMDLLNMRQGTYKPYWMKQ